MKNFLDEAEQLYEIAGFAEEANFGLISKAIEWDNELLKFTVLNSAKAYTKVKKPAMSMQITRGFSVH